MAEQPTSKLNPPTIEDFVASWSDQNLDYGESRCVDAVIDQLKPLLEPGDIIIDGGNSFYEDTQRRGRDLASKGWNLLAWA